MRKRFLSLALVFCTLSLLMLPACAVENRAESSSVPEDIRTADTTVTFTDIDDNAWYAEAVRFCSEQGIMGGTTDTTFSPDVPMTRAMLAAVLYRVDGSPPVTAGTDFTDAAGGAWYNSAVSWASGSGILSGYGNGLFGVDDPVTREQAAAVLWRYARSPEFGTTGEAFADGASISTWALTAVNWAKANGIMNGKTGNRFDPKAELTRGETAVLLHRYLGRNSEDAPLSEQVLVISVGGRDFTAVLEDNTAARALAERLPLTVTMDELNGNEKYYDLPEGLPTDPERPGAIQAGDLMLYGSDCLVLFYESFASSYSYTRLGRITDPAELAEAVGSGNVEVTFRMQTQENIPSANTENKILVAYFSATGTTRTLAEYAANSLDADLYEIVPEVPYTADDLNYNNSASRANREQNDSSARPAISGSVEDMGDYDVVLLGYPIWHGQAPKIIYTFLESYDFSGKTIVPFCTSHSSGIGSSDTNLHALATGADWRSGRRFPGGTSRETITDWIDGLELPRTSAAMDVGVFDFETRTVMLNSGYTMPINGLGTYSLTGETCFASVSAALERGVRLTDTAYMYHNEAEVGRAVRESGIPREEIFVITKLYPSQFSDAEAAIDQALETLGLDYIDMMLLHHPGDGDVAAYQAMEQAVAEGKIRSIGLSNWYVEELEEFLPQVSITPSLVQNEIHPYYQENDVIPYIQSLGIVVQGWYPLGGRGHTAELLGDEVISGIAAAHGKSSAQVILRWNLQKGVVVIPGSSNPDHIQENTELYDFELTEAEMARINALNRNEKHDWY